MTGRCWAVTRWAESSLAGGKTATRLFTRCAHTGKARKTPRGPRAHPPPSHKGERPESSTVIVLAPFESRTCATPRAQPPALDDSYRDDHRAFTRIAPAGCTPGSQPPTSTTKGSNPSRRRGSPYGPRWFPSGDLTTFRGPVCPAATSNSESGPAEGHTKAIGVASRATTPGQGGPPHLAKG